MDLEENGRIEKKNAGRGKRSTNSCLKYSAAISASITTVGFGMIMSWTSPSLPYLTGPSSHTPVSEMQGSWIAALNNCGAILGFVFIPIIINRIGSKRTLLCLAVPQILSWILICLGRNWIFLCVARVVGGVGYGGGLCSTAVYLGEIGDPSTRGIFLAFIKLSTNIGTFITMLFGAFLSYDAMNLALLGMPVIFFVSFFFMPDTSRFSESEDITENTRETSGKNVDVLQETKSYVFKGNDDGFVDEDGIVTPSKDRNGVFKDNEMDLKANIQGPSEENKSVFSEKDTTVVLNGNPDDLPDKNINNSPKDPLQMKLRKDVVYVFKENRDEVEEDDILNEGEDDENVVPNKDITNLQKENESKESEITNNTNEDSKEKKQRNIVDNGSLKSIWWELLTLRNNRRALLIIFVAFLTDLFSGHIAIVSFTQQIFEYSGASLKAEYAALMLAALKIGASSIAFVVVERFERRVIFLSTGILAGCAQVFVGLFFFLKMYLETDVSSITWMPITMVSACEILSCIGFGNLCFVYQGEIFGNDVKGPGVALSNIFYESVAFLIKVTFQTVLDAVGVYSVFWGFGVCCFVGSLIIYLITPETRGKSRDEIQKLLGADHRNIVIRRAEICHN